MDGMDGAHMGDDTTSNGHLEWLKKPRVIRKKREPTPKPHKPQISEVRAKMIFACNAVWEILALDGDVKAEALEGIFDKDRDQAERCAEVFVAVIKQRLADEVGSAISCALSKVLGNGGEKTKRKGKDNE